MADFQRVLSYDDALDQQLQELLLLGQGGIGQPAADTLTERLQVNPDLLGGTPLAVEPRPLLLLRLQNLPAGGNLLAAIF